jgi:hypothetical protein
MKNDAHASSPKSHYRRLLIMGVLSFLSMYALMYAMVDTFGNVYSNFNQLYMAGLMTAPMIVIELFLMRSMFPVAKLNVLIASTSVLAMIVFFLFIRQQTAISDRQFLKSMIPHHASAILMCEQAPIRDPEIVRLCEGILSSQQAEIALMKNMLGEARE